MKFSNLDFSKVIFIITCVISVGLLVAGFILPPRGVIDPSCLTAVGELFAFASLGQLPQLLRKDKQFVIHSPSGSRLEVGNNKYTDSIPDGRFEENC